VGIEVGGHHERIDLPKLGPSLLIASALILAIRTARWTATHDVRLSNKELEKGDRLRFFVGTLGAL
jgi:hypothetical protein